MLRYFIIVRVVAYISLVFDVDLYMRQGRSSTTEHTGFFPFQLGLKEPGRRAMLFEAHFFC